MALCLTHFDSEDDYRTGCRDRVSHCQQQPSFSGLRSPRRSNSTYSYYYFFSQIQIQYLYQKPDVRVKIIFSNIVGQ